MRLKENFFTGPQDYTFKVELVGHPPCSLTVAVDEFRYFEIEKFPQEIPLGIYAEYVSGAA